MTKPIMLIVKVPFPGFYGSMYSEAVDHEESRWCEDKATESDHDDDESHYPDELRLDAGDLIELFMFTTNYGAAYEQIASDYVAALDHVCGEAFGLSVADTRQRFNYQTNDFEPEPYQRPSIRATFESMDSPREYNFTTDRVYAHIPLAIMRHLLKRSKAEGHATLAQVVRDSFTSRDGFSSFYSNDLADWLAKPLQDWDHNELGTLLLAAMTMEGADPESDETRDSLYYETLGDCGAYEAWESAVDWPAFEAKRNEKRAEKLAEWLDDSPEDAKRWAAENRETLAELVAAEPDLFTGETLDDIEIAPARCPDTLDLFAQGESVR